jgi:NADPH:quinone reductase-like Zn-dependent oxidoreductase
MSELRNGVVQVSRLGGPERLEVVEALPPGRGEARVRVFASGLEYTDVQRPSPQ